MSRKPRVQGNNVIYHVLSRGNNKELIFREQSDYLFFLNSLTKRKSKYKFKVLCYALLPNHFHLLIKTSEETSISTIMKSLLTSHSQFFNYKYHRVGHLFQGRFKSFICDADPYLVTLISYIHQNAKRAGLVEDSSQYKYSSLQNYLTNKRNKLVDRDIIEVFLEEAFGRKGTVLIKKLS